MSAAPRTPTRRPAPMDTSALLQLEQMKHLAEDALHRAEERTIRYRLQVEALTAALERLTR